MFMWRVGFTRVKGDFIDQIIIYLFTTIQFYFYLIIKLSIYFLFNFRIARRIREDYLRSVLRQNIAYFDKLGAGEVTTRITSDTHLIQDGISEKVAMALSVCIKGC